MLTFDWGFWILDMWLQQLQVFLWSSVMGPNVTFFMGSKIPGGAPGFVNKYYKDNHAEQE